MSWNMPASASPQRVTASRALRSKRLAAVAPPEATLPGQGRPPTVLLELAMHAVAGLASVAQAAFALHRDSPLVLVARHAPGPRWLPLEAAPQAVEPKPLHGMIVQHE